MNDAKAVVIVVCGALGLMFCGLLVREVADIKAGRTYTCFKAGSTPLTDSRYVCTAEEWRHQQESKKR